MSFTYSVKVYIMLLLFAHQRAGSKCGSAAAQ
jgi:hypothetical protein